MADTITGTGISIQCSIINGVAAPPGQDTVFWDVPGHNNSGVQITGRRRRDNFVFRLVKMDTFANVMSWFAAVSIITGRTVTVVNSANQSFANCVVETTEVIQHPIASANVGGEGTGGYCVMAIRGRRFI